jgi:hypothetical protein
MSKARIWGYPNEEEMAKGVVAIFCPGCECLHHIYTKVPTSGGAVWGFNNDFELPTFTPSLLIKTGSYADPNFVDPPEIRPSICHSFITNGCIQFLGDCTHSLAGSTLPLPDLTGEESISPKVP